MSTTAEAHKQHDNVLDKENQMMMKLPSNIVFRLCLAWSWDIRLYGAAPKTDLQLYFLQMWKLHYEEYTFETWKLTREVTTPQFCHTYHCLYIEVELERLITFLYKQ